MHVQDVERVGRVLSRKCTVVIVQTPRPGAIKRHGGTGLSQIHSVNNSQEPPSQASRPRGTKLDQQAQLGSAHCP